MISAKPSGFLINNESWEFQCDWLSPIQRTRLPASKVCLSVYSEKESHIFVTNMNSGFIICEDFREGSNKMIEISTEKMQVTSLDFKQNSDPEEPNVLFSFNLGNILILDPIKRRRGQVTWFNTNKSYSTKPPCIVRWVKCSASQFVVVFEDNTMWRLDTNFKEDPRTISNIQQRIRDAKSISSDFAVLNATAEDSTLQVWRFFCSSIRDLCFVSNKSRNPSLFAIATSSGQVKVFDIQRGTSLVTYNNYFGGLWAVAFSDDGRLIAAGGEDDCISVWDMHTHKLICRGSGHNSWVSSICVQDLDHHTYRIWSASQDGRMLAWEVQAHDTHKVNGELGVGNRLEVNYPTRGMIPWNEPIAEVLVSLEPLAALALSENHVFVADSSGAIYMWERENKFS